jgi:hypothetical protein
MTTPLGIGGSMVGGLIGPLVFQTGTGLSVLSGRFDHVDHRRDHSALYLGKVCNLIRLDTALTPQFALKAVEGREDETRQFGVFSKEETRDCHHLATGNAAHASNHQRDTEKGSCCELSLSAAKDR